MNKNEVLDKIKVLLGMEKPVESTPSVEETADVVVAVEFTEAKLKDGTNVSFGNLEIGSNFLIKTDAQTSVPAPEGDYLLEDGTIVTVGGDNLISGITLPVANADPTTNPTEPIVTIEPTTEEPAEPVMTIDEKVSKLEDEVEQLKTMLEMIVGGYEGMKSEYAAQFSKQEEKIKELENAPAAQPVHFAKVEDVKPASTFEKRIEALNKLKTQ